MPNELPLPLSACRHRRLCGLISHVSQHATRFVRPSPQGEGRRHTPSIAFLHLPPNSARFGYATEGALFISAQLSSDAVSALRKVQVLA